MEKDRIDKLFKEKLDSITGLPSDMNWSSENGWNDYEKQYLTKKISPTKMLIYISSIAAAILIAYFTILSFRDNQVKVLQITNNTAAVKEIKLPDGNRIWLNTKSAVEYPSKIDKNHGEFIVDGEAYFEFRKLQNPAYRIKAHNAIVIVENPCTLNIRARNQDENVNITVVSGALKIMEESYQKGLALVVTEGNYCSVHKSQNLVYTSINRNENFLAWKTGKLTFDSMPMATVTDILAEYYHTQIEFKDKSLAYCLFSGTFKDQSLDIVLNQVKTNLNCVISITGDKITISGKGCF